LAKVKPDGDNEDCQDEEMPAIEGERYPPAMQEFSDPGKENPYLVFPLRNPEGTQSNEESYQAEE
jgi:hypothetical protein